MKISDYFGTITIYLTFNYSAVDIWPRNKNRTLIKHYINKASLDKQIVYFTIPNE